MGMRLRSLFEPIRKPSFAWLFLAVLPLVAGTLMAFIHPAALDASDLAQIALTPGRDLLTTGTVPAQYPYPAWTVVVMLPLALLPERAAMLVWFICNILMLAASLALLLRLLDQPLSPIAYALLVCLSTLFLPVLTTIWLGQLNIFLLLVLALSVSLFLQKRWTWLGIVLGLSFLKPQVMILPAGLLLLWALGRRHWRLLAGFGAVMLVLVLISLAFISSPVQILGGGVGYHLDTYIGMTSTLWGLLFQLGLPPVVSLLVCLALLVWLGWMWLPALRMSEIPSGRFLFLLSAATLVNLIIIPYSWMHNLALLLLPLAYSLVLALRRKGGKRFLWLSLLFFIMHPLMLGLFVLVGGSEGRQTYQVITALVLLPVMVILNSKRLG
jgi:hypothetical protein